ISQDRHGIISRRIEIGRSLWDKPVWMVRVSDNAHLDEDEPEVFYNSLIHAREGMSLMTLLYYLRYLVQSYPEADSVREVVDSREMYFVPIVNPDGYEINWQKYNSEGSWGLWRKNARDVNSDSVLDSRDGVDLNRNFDYMWGYDDRGSSSDSRRNDYRGTGAFSEPESRVIQDFLAGREMVTALNYHSYANVILYPFNYINELPPDSLLYKRLSELLTSDNGYRTGNAARALGSTYRANGEMTDWMYGDRQEKGKIFAWAPEIGTYNDGFWPPAGRITPLAAEHLSMNLWLARFSGFWPVLDSVIVEFESADSTRVSLEPVLSNPALVPSSGEVTVRLEVKRYPRELVVIDSVVVFPSMALDSPPVSAGNKLRLEFTGNLFGAELAFVVYEAGNRVRSFAFELEGPALAVDFDLDSDGAVNIFDLLSMLRVLSSGSPSPEQVISHDLDKDGKVNIFDLLGLLRELSRIFN
ncbi:MAG: M14 family zinc carboxypeptidase, partial [Gemmatimonadota bacterium]|nr:M14 family zinc carboxypeptidase [Gemmatimonadota bacterium]